MPRYLGMLVKSGKLLASIEYEAYDYANMAAKLQSNHDIDPKHIEEADSVIIWRVVE